MATTTPSFEIHVAEGDRQFFLRSGPYHDPARAFLAARDYKAAHPDAYVTVINTAAGTVSVIR